MNCYVPAGVRKETPIEVSVRASYEQHGGVVFMVGSTPIARLNNDGTLERLDTQVFGTAGTGLQIDGNGRIKVIG